MSARSAWCSSLAGIVSKIASTLPDCLTRADAARFPVTCQFTEKSPARCVVIKFAFEIGPDDVDLAFERP